MKNLNRYCVRYQFTDDDNERHESRTVVYATDEQDARETFDSINDECEILEVY